MTRALACHAPAWLAILALGCGHPTPRPPPRPTPVELADAGVDAVVALEDDPPRHAARALALFLDWQRALAGAGEDCDAAAARMNAIAEANSDLIAANARVLRGDRAKVQALREELAKREAEMAPAAKAISESPLMAKCAAVPAFARAVDRLGGEG